MFLPRAFDLRIFPKRVLVRNTLLQMDVLTWLAILFMYTSFNLSIATRYLQDVEPSIILHGHRIIRCPSPIGTRRVSSKTPHLCNTINPPQHELHEPI